MRGSPIRSPALGARPVSNGESRWAKLRIGLLRRVPGSDIMTSVMKTEMGAVSSVKPTDWIVTIIEIRGEPRDKSFSPKPNHLLYFRMHRTERLMVHW